MGLFTGVGDFFRGVFGEDDEEKRRRKQREAQEAAARQRQQQVQSRPQPQPQYNQQQKVQNVQDLFGNKRQNADPLGVTPLQQNKPQQVQPPKPQAPRVVVQPIDAAQIRQKAMDYQKPKVQDVNNYYGNDLKVLQQELAKGDKTDYHRVRGIMQSLDNRKKELSEFHKTRGENQSFKSARELDKQIKATRGDWTEKKQKLQQFWDGVSSNEKQDFMNYLTQRGMTPADQKQAVGLMSGGTWRNGNGQNFTPDFSKDAEEVKRIKQRQTIADMAREKQDIPLDQLNNKTIAQYRSEFEKQNPDQQRNTMHMLEKYMTDIGDNPSGNKDLERKLQQSYILYNVLEDDGTQRGNFGTRLKDIGAGAKRFGGALLESPERVVQSIGALAGDDPGGDIVKDYQSGKINAEEYNRKLNEYRRKNEWAVKADTPGKRLLTATGTAADTVATFLPLGSFFKGGKALKAGEAATKSLGRLSAEEAAANAGFSGAGSLREGTFDPKKTLTETATGATIGAVAPVAGSKAMQLWRRLRGLNTAAPEALEDVGRVTSRLESGEQAATDATRTAARETDDRIRELRAIVDDVETPSFQKVPARQELAALEKSAADDAAKAVGAGESALDRPAFQHKQDVENILKRENDNFNRFLTEHPELTPAQIEAAQTAARDRALKLVDDLNKSRFGNEAAISEEAAANQAVVEGQQAAAGEVAANRAAATSPNPATVVEGTSTPQSPEAAANNAYAGQSTEDVLYGSDAVVPDKGRLSIPQLLSPNRVIRENVTRPLWENLVDRPINALQTSGNKVLQPLGRLFTGFSRESGVAPELQTAKMQLRGGVETGKLNRETVADLSKGFGDESLNRVWATLDPEFAQRAGMQVPDALTPAEAGLQGKLKTVIDNTTQENLRRGLITPEQAASESYIKRSYSVYDGNTEAGKFERGFRQELLKQYKGRKEVSDDMVELAIKDPTYLVGKKTAESNAMWAMQDYGNYLAKSGTVIDTPRAGFIQLPDSPVFGEAAGRYAPQNVAEDFTGFQYTNAMVSAWNDLITAYDRIGIRQAKKQLLTIFNPAVRLGNQVTNRGIFTQLGGINPLQFNATYATVGKDIAENTPIYREAVAQGLTGVDITQAEFFARRVAQAGEDVNLGRKALDWVKNSYSGADDKARVTAYKIHRARGYSPEEAARLTQRAFQDYKSVGFFYDMAAKTPIIGNAFVRFAADSVRVAKNAVIDHPLSVMGTVAAWSTLVNGMSVVSGESQLKGDTAAEQAFNLVTGRSKSDAQREREGRFGAPKIPFTDISTTIQTPWGEVNVARFMPWYQLNDISESQVSKFLPFQANPLTPQGWNDPLLGQVLNVAVDKDFRGKSIRDPANSDGRMSQDPLSAKEQKDNVLRYLFANNAPLGKEIDQTRSAIQGKPDIYGKERSVPQAIARDLGFKIEQQGAKQAKDRKDTEAYFKEKEEIDKEVQGMSPAAQEAYKRLTGYYKLHDKVPNEFSPGDTRYKKAPQYDFSEDKWKELAAHPELYKLMVDKKQREFAKDGKPVPPEYDPRLSEGFRKQLLQNKMVAPGDDAELDQRMYSQPEWDYYQMLRDKYKDASKKYYKDDGNDDFVDELVKHQDAKFPTKPTLLKQYSAAYKDYLDGKRDKPQFSDDMKKLKEQYNHQTLNWTNTERKARGLPAITWDTWNNPTFGFDESPSGFGFGFGGGGGSKYDPSLHVNALGKLSNFSGDVPELKAIEAQTPPNVVQLFQKLMAGGGGGRAKPKLGAGNRGA